MTRRSRCLLLLSVVLAVAPLAWASAAGKREAVAIRVRTANGALSGTATADGARAFLGIPYAAPPVGARRWQAPGPAPSWTGLRDATRPGAPCAQPGLDRAGALRVIGSEDCLTLNVYAPRGAGRDLPVMVFIHGGGQMYGSGAQYDGARLAARQQVVVVTINYRLGLLGWFHHPAITGTGQDRRTGQFALLDAMAALRWVRQNIAAFGGAPGNVTVFGESAGAQNVYGLVFAPATRGLFDKAIAESGGLWNMALSQAVNYRDEADPGTPLSAREVVAQLLVDTGRAADRDAAKALAARAGDADLARWLRALPVAALLGVEARAPHADYDLPSVVYDDVLIPAGSHHDRLARGDYHRVPLLIGGNRDEQKLYLAADPALRAVIDGNTVVRDRERYEAINRYYSQWWNFSAVDNLAGRLADPVYAYRFEWDDEPERPVDIRALYGAAHGLELAFVFGRFDYGFVHDDLPGEENATPGTDPYRALFNEANRQSRERVSEAMMAYWATFARRGAPGNGGIPGLPTWPAWSAGGVRLVFGNQGVSIAAGVIDGAALLDEIRASTLLTTAEKCAILLDHTMYPSYAAYADERRGCPAAP